MHVKSSNFSFCFANWIVGSEVGFEFLKEKIEIQSHGGSMGSRTADQNNLDSAFKYERT